MDGGSFTLRCSAGYPVKLSARTNLQVLLVGLQVVGDAAFCFLGQWLALWLRFFSPLRQLGFASENAQRNLFDYFPLLYLGTALLLGTFFYLQLYDSRLLLRRYRALSIIIKGVFFWFCVFLGTSLALKFEPSVSRLFVLLSAATTLALLTVWRYLFHAWLSRSDVHEGLVQRIAVLGWSEEAAKLATAIRQDPQHTYRFAGAIDTGTAASLAYDPRVSILGRAEQLESLLEEHRIDILVLADPLLNRDDTLAVAALCERRYVAFKVIPNFFQIFVANLRLQSISGVSLLGVDGLPLDSLANRIAKRSLDIVGALVGLVLSLPIIAVLAILIKRESPGPIIYKQTRVGRNGSLFTIFKLRSMRLDAEAGSGARWASENDPRRTKIGAFMRETNLDELPQFWNVLKGEMSLVGPRPERPELISKFEWEIPHYNPRHTVRPGLSGWAQINGLRGDTSLTERVRYDLYYIENWSIWFDIQIMLLTFVRLRNAY